MHSNDPGGAALPEADRSDMEFYLDQVEIVLPALGLDILRAIVPPSVQGSAALTLGPAATTTSPEFKFNVGDALATATEINGEFVVRNGSIARNSEAPSLPKTYRALREKLKADGTLVSGEGGSLVFSKDTPFDSPTAAAAVVYGASISGPANWYLTSSEQTYAQFRESSLAAAAG